MKLTCNYCGGEFFRPKKAGQIPKYCTALCRNRNWAEKNPHRKQERLQQASDVSRLYKYGVSGDEYREMLEKQKYLCAICNNPPSGTKGAAKSLHVDHCHTTGRKRALLCSKCNTGLGLFNDEKLVLKAAIQYLEKHK